MSGGSMGYIYSSINDYADMLGDPELVDLAKDLSKIFHDCEWWHSSDIGRDDYIRSIVKFKAKWFRSSVEREERLKGYVDKSVDELREELYTLIGERTEKGEQK